MPVLILQKDVSLFLACCHVYAEIVREKKTSPEFYNFLLIGGFMIEGYNAHFGTCFQSFLITYPLEKFLKSWEFVNIFLLCNFKSDVIRRIKIAEPIISINNIGEYPLHLLI